MRKILLALAVCLPGMWLSAQDTKPIRTGWNSFNGVPYSGCWYLEVTGPAAAKELIVRRAKAQYRDADQAALDSVADRVVVRVGTMSSRSCSDSTPSELIFVEKKADAPKLRLKLDADTAVLQNGFGATWESTDGVAIVPVNEFRSALADGKYKVVVVMKSGSTREINAGLGNVTWSGGHTERVVGRLMR